MTVSAHQITAQQVRALAAGTSTAEDLDVLVRSQRSKTLALLDLIARQAIHARHPQAAAAAAGWDLLAVVQRRAPRAAEAMLGYPAVGAWASETLSALDSSPDRGSAQPGHLAAIAAAAALVGGVRAAIEFPPPAGDRAFLHLPSLGSVTVPPHAHGAARVVCHREGAAEIVWPRDRLMLPADLESSGGRWRALVSVRVSKGSGHRLLVIDDADPYRLPGHDEALASLVGPQAGQWRSRVRRGWNLLARRHAQTSGEVRALVTALIPLHSAAGASLSTTSRRTFGAIGLSLPHDDVSMALVFAHEVQHAKLCALMDLIPLLDDRADDLYYAPWRPDPRPLAGLLQGLYAHMGVTRFWRRQQAAGGGPADVYRAQVEFARWRSACWEVATLIARRPEVTAYGAVFVDGMIQQLRCWQRVPVPQPALDTAMLAAEEHRRRWEKPASAIRR